VTVGNAASNVRITSTRRDVGIITSTTRATSDSKPAIKVLTLALRRAFPDFRAEIHWQLADGDRVITFKTYHGTHEGPFYGISPSHRKIQFETVDVMRVQNGKITDHWGVANLLSLMQQIGGWTPP
jgi:predicted ester cyclase